MSATSFTSRETTIGWEADDNWLGFMEVNVVVPDRHEAYFCSKCGKLWARRYDSGAEGWYITLRDCARDGDGSLIEEQDYVSVLPELLMVRELIIFGGKQNG